MIPMQVPLRGNQASRRSLLPIMPGWSATLTLNSTSKVLTTSVLYLQKRAVDGLEDGFLFFGQGHHARKLEPVLGVAEINFGHGGQLQQGTLGGELRVA